MHFPTYSDAVGYCYISADRVPAVAESCREIGVVKRCAVCGLSAADNAASVPAAAAILIISRKISLFY